MRLFGLPGKMDRIGSKLQTRTRGASGLMRVMGVLEATDGMLLFDISAAYIFTSNASLLGS